MTGKPPDITITELCVELTRIREEVMKHVVQQTTTPAPEQMGVVNDLFRLQIRCADAKAIR